MKECFITGKHKWILVFLVSLFLIQFYGATNSNVGANSNSDDWPMFRHDPAHSGYSSSAAPMTNQTLWSFKTDAIVDSSPVVADGVVYIGSTDFNLYSLNATNGVKIWSFPTGSYPSYLISSPAVAGGVVFIGSRDGSVYALNAATGDKIWSYQTGGDVDSSPAVAGGVVYVGSNDGNVYAFGVSHSQTAVLFAAVFVVVIAVVAVGILAYFKKRKH